MNERDSKMIYEVKQRILGALKPETDNDLQYERFKQVVSEAIETFLHPPTERK